MANVTWSGNSTSHTHLQSAASVPQAHHILANSPWPIASRMSPFPSPPCSGFSFTRILSYLFTCVFLCALSFSFYLFQNYLSSRLESMKFHVCTFLVGIGPEKYKEVRQGEDFKGSSTVLFNFLFKEICFNFQSDSFNIDYDFLLCLSTLWKVKAKIFTQHGFRPSFCGFPATIPFSFTFLHSLTLIPFALPFKALSIHFPIFITRLNAYIKKTV